jgi:hypothetical protein
VGSARRTSSGGRRERRRERAAFFTEPAAVAQRRYEALRAYFVEQASAAEVAQRFGYAPSTVVAMVRDFEPDAGEFFLERRPRRSALVGRPPAAPPVRLTSHQPTRHQPGAKSLFGNPS